jgi:hypothetical protein
MRYLSTFAQTVWYLLSLSFIVTFNVAKCLLPLVMVCLQSMTSALLGLEIKFPSLSCCQRKNIREVKKNVCHCQCCQLLNINDNEKSIRG